MRTIFYTATSLDGFLATPDDDVSWLDTRPPPSEDTYAPFIANVGALCMGSATYEGRLATGEKVIQNIRMWADGHRPPDQVLEGWA